MYLLIFVLIFVCVSGQQFPANSKNHSSIRFTNTFNRFPVSREFHVTANDQFIEQFNPNVGYSHSSPQKVQFTHDSKFHIHLLQNKLSIYCATDTIYERITWKKFTCPGQIDNQEGELIAVGSLVSNPNLYGVNSFARNEEYVSELLLKQSLTSQTDGMYVCEGTFISNTHSRDTSLVTFKDVIIIGGKGMYQNCFSQGGKL